MLDLDTSIREWRQQMLAADILSHETLDELESHLRDDVERRMESGSGAQEAFDAAVQQLGQAKTLQAEFAKVGEVMSAREHELTWNLGAVCVVLDVALGLGWLFMPLPAPLALSERMLGAAAWFLFPLVLWSWRYAYRLLPVLPGKRKRLAIGAMSTVMTGLCTAILLHLIPAGAAVSGMFVPATVWSFLPLVIGITCYVGLEEAAYRNLATRNS